MCRTNIPEISQQTIGEKAEWHERLALRNFGNVVAKLFFAFTGIAAGALRFDNSNHFARWVVEAIVSNAVPRRGIVAIYRHFTQHLSVIAEVPASFYQPRINENITGLRLVKFEHIGIVGIGQNTPYSG